MKFILGKKIEMTQRFGDNGVVTPVTVVKAGPCVVTQVKTKEKEGYEAVQIGFGQTRRLTKPLANHLKGVGKNRYLREFTVIANTHLRRGDIFTVDVFQVGDTVKVTGQSKGKGFQGVVRRHGFHGSPASHGHKDQLRMPGSIGATAPQRVLKGRRMAGQMGNERVTVKNQTIMEIDKENNLLYIKGAVPGARHNLLLISSVRGEMKITPEQKREEESQSRRDTLPITQKAEANQAEEKK